MNIESGKVVSLSEIDGSFSRLVDVYGSAVVALGDKPRDLNARDASNQEVEVISRRLIERNRAVYQELAK